MASLSLLGCTSGAAGSGGAGSTGHGSSTGASLPGAGLPCDVDAILGAHCRQCHGATLSYGAPMALVTDADLLAPLPSDPKRRVVDGVLARIHDDARPMPQAPNPRLSAADLATLDAYAAAGAPAGDCVPSEGSGGSGPALSCTPDTHVAPASPYTLPDGVSEAYVCYGFEAPPGPKRHITAFAPHIDDKAIVHHVSLLQSDTPVSPVPAVCPLGGSPAWRVVFGWAPGASAFELPKEAGFAEDASTHFVVQIHYANPTHRAPATDASGFDLCTTTSLRPNDADVMAFGTVQIQLPPHASTTLDCSIPVPSWGQATHLFAAFPHMHRLGTSIVSSAYPMGTGAPVDLGSQPHWNFGEQGWIPIDYALSPGDVVETKCSWDNTTDAAVSFGEKTEDEMCYSFVMYYPRITAPTWNWALPALYSTCH
jgi:hypothetical protein